MVRGFAGAMTQIVTFVSVLADMAWHPDPLVREIASEIDDREIDEIAMAIHDLVFGSDDAWEEAIAADPDAELLRSLAEPTATDRLPLDRAQEATLLARRIIDWAAYGDAYGDFSNPPWEGEGEEEEEEGAPMVPPPYKSPFDAGPGDW